MLALPYALKNGLALELIVWGQQPHRGEALSLQHSAPEEGLIQAASPATGNGEGMSGDIGRLVGGQEEDRIGYLEGLAKSTQWRHPVRAVLHRLV